MKKINLLSKALFRRGYIEIKDDKTGLFPTQVNRVYNIDPNKMNNQEIEMIFSRVLRGLDY